MLSKDVWRTNNNMLVPYYLMHSYLYYQKNEPIISDIEYDELCKTLKDKWNEVEHFHKHLVDVESLGAGTGYQVEYNQRIANSAMLLYDEYHNNKQSGDII